MNLNFHSAITNVTTPASSDISFFSSSTPSDSGLFPMRPKKSFRRAIQSNLAKCDTALRSDDFHYIDRHLTKDVSYLLYKSYLIWILKYGFNVKKRLKREEKNRQDNVDAMQSHTMRLILNGILRICSQTIKSRAMTSASRDAPFLLRKLPSLWTCHSTCRRQISSGLRVGHWLEP